MLDSSENQNSSPKVLAAQTEGTATEVTTAVSDDSTGQETSENDAGNISNDEVMSNNEDDQRVGFSSSTPSSKDLVNEQEGVTESKKEKEKRSASERLQRSKQQLKEKEDKITELETKTQGLQEQLNSRPDAAQLKEKDDEITRLKKQAQQDNGAKYTAAAGVGLAVGLVAFIALERTVRLNIWVMVGIAAASALVAGSITYAALPSTQVDGAEVQEVDGNNKGK